jgi:flavin reductase (DIM6/NTAB) family NADH-FMN oxidoreductase RutF
MSIPVRTALPHHDGGAVPADVLRATMRLHATGVAVITTSDGDPVGFCATSLTSVSLEPPTISFAVVLESTSGRAWRTADYGIVHLLRQDQAPVAAAFARPGKEKFAGVSWRRGPQGQPLLDSVLAWMLVSTRERLVVGDHLLVLCDVRAASTAPGPGPLIRHDGAFHALPAVPR